MSVIDIKPSMNAGEFEIINSLGSGATAEVFKAKNLKTDSFVALKSFSSFVSNDETALKRLRDEIQILKTFDHPNVVKMLGEHLVDSKFLLELELVEGMHLRDWIKEARNPLIEVDLWILVQVARGLGAVHEKGIIHRDLKPENILISNSGLVKLSDFGLAKELDRLTMTRLGLVVGSLGYMAPEVTEGEKSTTKSDLFSFGAVAYELISGQAPVHGETPQAILKKAMEPITPIDQVCPHIPPRIGQLIDQCLEQDPNLRPESIWAIESEIMGYLSETGLLPLCPSLVAIQPDAQIFKQALQKKHNYLLQKKESLEKNKKTDTKLFLSLANELMRLFPEDEAALELLRTLQKSNDGFSKKLTAFLFIMIMLTTGSFLLYSFYVNPQKVEIKSLNDVILKPGPIPTEKPQLTSVVPVSTDLVKINKPLEEPKKPTQKAIPKEPKKEIVKASPVLKKKPVVVAPQKGFISFEADDDVEIFVDDKIVAKSTWESFATPPGEHRIKMVKKGFLPIENKVTVKSGQTVKIRAKGKDNG